VPLASYSQRIAMFMGPPGRFATSPVRLPGARDELAIAPLAYGVVLAGGRDAAGARAADVVIYSAVTQTLATAASLPSPRARPAAFGASFNIVYFFGGAGDGDAPTADLWQLDTNVAPSGSYATLAAPATLARAGTAGLTIGTDRFLLTGSPPALLDATIATPTLTAIVGAPAGVDTATTGATTATAAGQVEVVVGGPDGVFLYDGAFKKIGDAAIVDAAAVTLPSTDVLLVGPDAHRVTVAGVVTDVTLTATARHRPAVAAARGTLVVAGGFDDDGAPIGDAELFDATTLAPMGTVPLPTPRGGAIAYPLTNGQILVVSGRGPGGPLATVEIFTP
jgi:hypothetical protein